MDTVDRGIYIQREVDNFIMSIFSGLINDDHGDIERYDVETEKYISASLTDWHAFYLWRNMAQWVQEWPGAFSRPVWLPSCGSWDDLEWILGHRWGSVTIRWWENITPRPRQQVVHPPAQSKRARRARNTPATSQAISSSTQQLSLLEGGIL